MQLLQFQLCTQEHHKYGKWTIDWIVFNTNIIPEISQKQKISLECLVEITEPKSETRIFNVVVVNKIALDIVKNGKCYWLFILQDIFVTMILKLFFLSPFIHVPKLFVCALSQFVKCINHFLTEKVKASDSKWVLVWVRHQSSSLTFKVKS